MFADMTDQILETFEQRPLDLLHFSLPALPQHQEHSLAAGYEYQEALPLEYHMQHDGSYQESMQQQEQHLTAPAVSPRDQIYMVPVADQGPWQDHGNGIPIQ